MMYKLEGIDNLESIDFIKNNIKPIGIFALSAFVLGFAIGYWFFPAENVVAVEGIAINEGNIDKALESNPR